MPNSNLQSSLRSRQVRQVYLITYSQVDVEICPSRQSFVTLIVGAFNICGIDVAQWVCSKENHTEGGFHYHMAVKLSERRRWLSVRNWLQATYHVRVNFSNNHNNYFSAWQYTTKEDSEYIQSENHPDLTNAEPPRTSQASSTRLGVRSGRSNKRKRQLSVFEVSELVVAKGFKTRLELLAFAQEQKREGKTDLAQFIANRGAKVVDEAIKVAWEMAGAPEQLIRSRQTRLQRLQGAFNGECVQDCNKKWLEMATNILSRNHIPKGDFTNAVYTLLEKGRGKYRNIIITGPSNCGKTFILNPLTSIFTTFSNPATATFAWVSVEDAEIIFLND